MALKPPPISEVMQQMNQLVGPAGLVDEVDRNARQLIQSALRKLDFVSREEFDAQTAILERTRGKIAALESELARMTTLLDKLEAQETGQ
ncbi:MAG: accessory factor UbiK family protein [Congregibacter sp.]|nr:accessory factor UbiK family protein [Congregibacter sp.]